jgi:hypothetical protein
LEIEGNIPVYVEGFRAHDGHSDGIVLKDAGDVTIVESESLRNRGYGLTADSSDGDVDDSVIEGNLKGAIRNAASRLTIRRGRIKGRIKD